MRQVSLVVAICVSTICGCDSSLQDPPLTASGVFFPPLPTATQYTNLNSPTNVKTGKCVIVPVGVRVEQKRVFLDVAIIGDRPESPAAFFADSPGDLAVTGTEQFELYARASQEDSLNVIGWRNAMHQNIQSLDHLSVLNHETTSERSTEEGDDVLLVTFEGSTDRPPTVGTTVWATLNRGDFLFTFCTEYNAETGEYVPIDECTFIILSDPTEVPVLPVVPSD